MFLMIKFMFIAWQNINGIGLKIGLGNNCVCMYISDYVTLLVKQALVVKKRSDGFGMVKNLITNWLSSITRVERKLNGKKIK